MNVLFFISEIPAGMFILGSAEQFSNDAILVTEAGRTISESAKQPEKLPTLVTLFGAGNFTLTSFWEPYTPVAVALPPMVSRSSPAAVVAAIFAALYVRKSCSVPG